MKGSVLDTLFVALSVAIIAVAALIYFYVGNQLHAGLQSRGFTEDELAVSSNVINVIGGFNLLVVLLFVGLQLATIVSAFAIKSHPVYFAVFFITQLIILNVVPIFTQLYTAVYDNPTFALYASQFNWVKLLIDNFTLLTMAFSFVVALAMFGLPGGGGREG